MGKPYRHLWRDITSFENLLLAFKKAARGKRSEPGVGAFQFNVEENLLVLRSALLDGSYAPAGYTNFLVHDPKRRLISAAPFRACVVHHALMNVTGPLFERRWLPSGRRIPHGEQPIRRDGHEWQRPRLGQRLVHHRRQRVAPGH